MLPPEVRASTFFAFNPKRLILDPITGTINDGFELVESIQFIASKVLDDVEKDMGKTYTLNDLIKNGVVGPNYKPE